MWNKIAAYLGLFLLFACGPVDNNFNNIENSIGSDKIKMFVAFPLDERFRLYNKVYNKRWRPHKTELAIGFRDQPERAISYIVNDLISSTFSDFIRYFPIIYDLSKNSHYNLCRGEYVLELRKIIHSYRLSNEQLNTLNGIHLGKCDLI